MTVKLNQPVEHPDGSLTTIRQLLAQGRAKLAYSPRFGPRGVPAYFAELTDAPGCWQIGKLAYLSATGQEIQL